MIPFMEIIYSGNYSNVYRYVAVLFSSTYEGFHTHKMIIYCFFKNYGYIFIKRMFIFPTRCLSFTSEYTLFEPSHIKVIKAYTDVVCGPYW